MNAFLRRSEKFIKRNGATILTCVGGIGVIATTITAIKAGEKATLRLNEAREEKGDELTALEKVTVAGPIYAPPILLGASTIACIFGANVLNKRQQAGIASAYALLDNSYKEYKSKVAELYGPDADKNVRTEIIKDQYDREQKTNSEKQLFYDEFSGRYFESTLENVLAAEYELNRILAKDCGVYLNEFYELLGIDTVDYGDYLGWSTFAIVEMYYYSWIEFSHETVVMDDGLECTIIYMNREPIHDFEDY